MVYSPTFLLRTAANTAALAKRTTKAKPMPVASPVVTVSSSVVVDVVDEEVVVVVAVVVVVVVVDAGAVPVLTVS